MTSILRDTLLEVLNCIEALGVLESAYAVIGGAFKYAKSKKNQLGRKLDDTGVKTGDICKQTIKKTIKKTIKTKSNAGERKSAIPEFVVEEIIVAKER